jgi:pimeloyl-ACP methyl ester carboxylesterase
MSSINMGSETINKVPSPEYLSIRSKPSAPISHIFFPAINPPSSLKKHLIVFVNGLGLPASSWLPSIQILHDSIKSCPAILTYDRYAQGLTTARDPLDTQKPLGHDFVDVANDLHEVITTIATSKLGLKTLDLEEEKLHLLLVGASIGAPIIRLYVQHHPGNAAGIILLNSNICVDYSAVWPDPDAPGFDPESIISDDCTTEQYRVERSKISKMFDLQVRNPEGLDRSNSAVLLPHADAPKLVGVNGKGPELTVVGHDPETFAEMSFMMMGTPKSLSERLTNP